MVMPIWDHNPFKWPKPPYVMWSLIVVNFAVFFLQVGTGPQEMAQTDRLAGLIPAAFTSGTGAAGVPAALTLITYQFLHANFMHVFGNMIFLFVFGDDIEELLGHWRFLAFYLACGAGPVSPTSIIPVRPSSVTVHWSPVSSVNTSSAYSAVPSGKKRSRTSPSFVALSS